VHRVGETQTLVQLVRDVECGGGLARSRPSAVFSARLLVEPFEASALERGVRHQPFFAEDEGDHRPFDIVGIEGTTRPTSPGMVLPLIL